MSCRVEVAGHVKFCHPSIDNVQIFKTSIHCPYISSKNYLSWMLDADIHLKSINFGDIDSINFGDILKDGNKAS